MRAVTGAFLILLINGANVAHAGVSTPIELSCPVGGEAFAFAPTVVDSAAGTRPDGKPYGNGDVPPVLPICPSNGLVVFQKEFSPDDKAALEKLIVDPGYKALDDDTSYYRAAWLMRRLDRDPLEIADMLLQASWQADGRPALKRRYQAEFTAIVDPLLKGDRDGSLMVLAGRAADAYRELGQFEAAGAVLDALPMASLTAIVPAEERDGDTVTNQDAIDTAKARRALFVYLAALKDLVAGRNAMMEPVSLLPPAIVARRCASTATLSDDDRAYCASDAAKQAIGTTR